MGLKKAAAEHSSLSRGSLNQGEDPPSSGAGEGGLVQGRKRTRRSSSVQLMEMFVGPTTPLAKELKAQMLSCREVQPPKPCPELTLSAKRAGTAPFGLDSLPWEVKLRILQHLPPADLCTMSQVNKTYYTLCSCDLLWALHCLRSGFCRASVDDTWKWNFVAATIGIVHAKLLDDSKPSHVLRLKGNAYIIDPMHAFFTSDEHRWRWSQEVLPILDTLDNADVLVTYRGLQCAIIQTRFGEGVYQITRRRRPLGTVSSASGFLAIVPEPLMKLLQEERENERNPKRESGTESGTTEVTSGTEIGKPWRCETQSGNQGAVLVRNLDGTLYTSRTGDFLVSSVWEELGTVETDVVGLDLPVDLMVTTGGDWSVDDEEDEDELDEDDVRFLEVMMRAEKASSSDISHGESSIGDGEISQDRPCLSASALSYSGP